VEEEAAVVMVTVVEEAAVVTVPVVVVDVGVTEAVELVVVINDARDGEMGTAHPAYWFASRYFSASAANDENTKLNVALRRSQMPL
jgi:hypothetical protein